MKWNGAPRLSGERFERRMKMNENDKEILYSYDRGSYNDEEARKRYSAYMQKLMQMMADGTVKGSEKR